MSINRTYSEVTEATENFIRELFANDDPLPMTELKVRRAVAQAAVRAWYEETRSLALHEVHDSEHMRLDELAFELAAGARVIG